MRSIFCIVLSIWYACAVAQGSSSKKLSVKDVLFEGTHFGFSIIPIVTQKASTRHLSGPYSLGATPVRGIGAGVQVQYHISDHYSFSIGLQGFASVRNHTFFIPRTAYTPQDPSDFEETGRGSRSADLYLTLPLTVERRWLNSKGNHWNIAVGIKPGFYPDQFGWSYSHIKLDANGQYYTAVDLDLDVGNDRKPWIDYHFGGGYSWLLKNNNLLRVNLVVTVSDMELARGSYQISVPGRPLSTGTYASSLSHAGISLNYILTGAKKRLRWMNEDQ